jgi:hypothetical protein
MSKYIKSIKIYILLPINKKLFNNKHLLQKDKYITLNKFYQKKQTSLIYLSISKKKQINKILNNLKINYKQLHLTLKVQ